MAALLWSSCGLFAKAPIFADWPEESRGMVLAFWRALFAAMVLVPFVRRPRFRPQMISLAFFFTGMNVSYLSAIALTTAANAIWLQSTCPWWVFLMSVLLFREPIVRRDLVPLLFGMAGVGVILAMEIRGESYAGVALGLIAGITYGGVVVFMRRLNDENPAWLICLNHFVAAAVLVPWLFWVDVWPSAWQFGVLVAFGTFQMALPYLFLLRGLRAVTAQEAVAIGLIEPVLMPLWVFLVWGEQPAWWTFVGGTLILFGLALRYLVLEKPWVTEPATEEEVLAVENEPTSIGSEGERS
jgi:drug/metabolite transporter (DMT)-like permease